MSGFVAIIADDPGAPVSLADADAFAASYVAVRGGVAEAVNAGERARAFEVRSLEDTRPSIVRRGEAWALAAGAPHHPDSLISAPLEDIEGQFALLRYDPQAGTITLASDPFGMFALFLARRGPFTYASTSALALARHLAAPPSRLGLQTFLLAGYQCGNLTGWEGIERVGAAMSLAFHSDGHTATTYWRPYVDRAIRGLSLAASVDRCLEAAVEAVRAAGAGRDLLWCDLTGGYDTRILALLAREAALPFVTATNGQGDEEDAALARRLAERAGWEWTLLSLPSSWPEEIGSRLHEALGWGDGALEVGQLSGVLWRHAWKAARSRAVLNGGGGEHYWSYAWQHEYGRSNRSGSTNLDLWVRTRMLRAVSMRVFAGDPMPQVTSDLRRRMQPIVEPYQDEPRSVQADLLYLHKSTGHFGAYASAAAGYVDLLLPFYTRASFTAAFSTNPRYRFGHRFYRRLIERLDPALAAIGTAKGGPAAPARLGNLLAFAPYYARLAEKGLNKVVQRGLGRSFRRPPGLGESAARARAAMVAQVGTSLDTWRSLPLYDPRALHEMLIAAGRPDFPDSVLLGRVLTAELALRAADAALA